MWKNVDGYNGCYQISSTGCVKSVQRTAIDGRVVKERILKPCIAGKGYKTVCLRKEGKTTRVYVHRLVCAAFVKNPKQLSVVNHKNGDKLDNDYRNLEWVSYSENNKHAYENNLKPSGEGFYSAKLTNKDVLEIRANGKYTTYQNIADKYGVSRSTIRDVLVGRTWK